MFIYIYILYVFIHIYIYIYILYLCILQAQHLALRVGDEMLEAFVGEHLVRADHLEGAVKKLEWARLTLQVLVQDVLHVQVARRLQTPCGMVHIGDACCACAGAGRSWWHRSLHGGGSDERLFRVEKNLFQAAGHQRLLTWTDSMRAVAYAKQSNGCLRVCLKKAAGSRKVKRHACMHGDMSPATMSLHLCIYIYICVYARNVGS